MDREPRMENSEIVPRLIDVLAERQHDYVDGGASDAIRQTLCDNLATIQQRIELLETKRTIAECNLRADSEEVEHKQSQRDAQFLTQNPELLSQHERRIDELLRSLGILGLQLRHIAARIEEYETAAEQILAKIEACDAQKNRFHQVTMGQAALLLEALAAIEPAEAFVSDGIEVLNDDPFPGIIARPASLAGDRIIIDITDQAMKNQPVRPSKAPEVGTLGEARRPVEVRIPRFDDEGLFNE